MRTFIACVLTAFATAMLVMSSPQPLNAPVMAQTAATKSDWISNERAAIRVLCEAAKLIQNQDKEYVANNYASDSVLLSTDLPTGGGSTTFTVAQLRTAHGNALNIADGILNNGAKSIASGTSTTLFLVR
jgi:hypothetical protein